MQLEACSDETRAETADDKRDTSQNEVESTPPTNEAASKPSDMSSVGERDKYAAMGTTQKDEVTSPEPDSANQF